MLRRKLLIRIGLLVACFVAGAVVAISLLQATIPDVDRINHESVVLLEGAHTVGDCVAEIEDARDGRSPPHTAPAAEARLRSALAAIGEHAAVADAASPRSAAYQRVCALLPAFLDSTEPVGERPSEMRTAARAMAQEMRSYVLSEQASFGGRFRGLVLGLTLAALAMVNVAVFVLLHTAQVVLRPVAELVEGSRELAAEHFDHRVKVDQQDEFGELARAHNRLAEQLQANEERKAETLRQLAVTINHDLNNAMSTIEMQLKLLDRQSGGSSHLARYIRDIQAALVRMARTVASLKNIRRVVLTDYVDGQKMVDLEQSVATLSPKPGPHGEPA